MLFLLNSAISPESSVLYAKLFPAIYSIFLLFSFSNVASSTFLSKGVSLEDGLAWEKVCLVGLASLEIEEKVENVECDNVELLLQKNKEESTIYVSAIAEKGNIVEMKYNITETVLELNSVDNEEVANQNKNFLEKEGKNISNKTVVWYNEAK